MDIQKILADYHRTASISETSRNFNVNSYIIRKHLIGAGVYSTPLVERIKELYAAGMPLKDIAVFLDISPTWINSNTPYTKGTYLTPDSAKSQNALRIRKCRAKKK